MTTKLEIWTPKKIQNQLRQNTPYLQKHLSETEGFVRVEELVLLLNQLNDGGCWIGQNDSRYDAFNYILELVGHPNPDSLHSSHNKEGTK